jgi:hypothetical protein
MSKKAIILQSQGLGSAVIPPIKEAGYVSVTVDNVKITIDAYDGGSGYPGKPREDSKMEIVDENEVFLLTPSVLLDVLRFYVEYGGKNGVVTNFRNRFHYVQRDAVKKPLKG